MWRNDIEIMQDQNVNLILNNGAIGDMITSLPAIQFLRATHTLQLNLNVWVSRGQVELVKHLIGQPGLTIRPLDEFNLKSSDPTMIGPGAMNGINPPVATRNRIPLVDFGYISLTDTMPHNDQWRNYPTAPIGPRTIEKDYIVLPVGATNGPSRFRGALVSAIAAWALSRQITPVLTGTKNTNVTMLKKGEPMKLVVSDEVDKMDGLTLAQCIDLREKTTLMELRDLCGHARAVVGIDGGTLHLAATTDVPIVYGCTRVKAYHRFIVRHDERNWNVQYVEPRELACGGCQSQMTLQFRHDFSECLYGDNLCTEKLHADDFINALKSLGV